MHSFSARPADEHGTFAFSGFLQAEAVFKFYFCDPAAYELAGIIFSAAIGEVMGLIAEETEGSGFSHLISPVPIQPPRSQGHGENHIIMISLPPGLKAIVAGLGVNFHFEIKQFFN